MRYIAAYCGILRHDATRCAAPRGTATHRIRCEQTFTHYLRCMFTLSVSVLSRIVHQCDFDHHFPDLHFKWFLESDRDGHELDPSTGWVGLGWVGLDWVDFLASVVGWVHWYCDGWVKRLCAFYSGTSSVVHMCKLCTFGSPFLISWLRDIPLLLMSAVAIGLKRRGNRNSQMGTTHRTLHLYQEHEIDKKNISKVLML